MNAIHKPELGAAAKLFLAKAPKMLIDGKWVDAISGETLPVEDPSTEEVITHVPAGNKLDVDRAVEAARRALESGPWGRLSPGERSKLIWRLGDLLEKHVDEFAEIESLDNGKPVANARRDQYDDLALGCGRAVRSMGSKAKIVAVSGGSKLGIDAVKSGDMAGTVCTKPETMGRLAAKALYDAINNNNPPKAQSVTYKLTSSSLSQRQTSPSAHRNSDRGRTVVFLGERYDSSNRCFAHVA